MQVCLKTPSQTDSSPPSGLSVLPGVIERTERTIIGHGLLDMILIYNGTLLVIQNVSVQFPGVFVILIRTIR